MDKNNKTVEIIFNEYIESSTLSLSTKKRYRKLFNRYIQDKDALIQDVTKADIFRDISWMIYIASEDTMRRVYLIWKHIIHYALYKEYISKDLIAGLVLPISRTIYNKKETTTDWPNT